MKVSGHFRTVWDEVPLKEGGLAYGADIQGRAYGDYTPPDPTADSDVDYYGGLEVEEVSVLSATILDDEDNPLPADDIDTDTLKEDLIRGYYLGIFDVELDR